MTGTPPEKSQWRHW